MNSINPHSTVQVAVYEMTLPVLIGLKQHPDEPLADVIERAANACSQSENKTVSQVAKSDEATPTAKYKHEILFLGTMIGANSFGELYSKLVDLLFDITPEAVEKLREMRARTRKYVARERSSIHPTSPHLPTLKTKSGWYVSDNVGEVDFIRGIRALCDAGGIRYGDDVQLVIR